MDIKERLERLRARRDPENKEDWDKMVEQAIPNNNEDLARLIELLGTADADQLEETVELIGGMEHYRPYEHITDQAFFFTGMESVSDGIVRIFDRIIAFIKRWIKVLADADFKLSLMTGLHQTTLENIRTEMRTTARTRKGSPTFPVSTRIEGISLNYKPLTNSQALLNALTVLRTVTELYFSTHDGSILRQVNQVVAAVNGKANHRRVAELMNEVSPKRLSESSIMKLDQLQSISPHLLGNHRFVVTNEDAHSSDKADQIHGIRIKMERSQLTNTNPVDVVQFEHFDVQMAEALLTKCDSVLTILSASNTGERRHGRRQGMQALLACIERIRAESDRGAMDETEARMIIALLESYTAWIADPYTSLYAYMLRTVKATLNVVAANFA
uniref:Internal head protein n=1 Tax=Pseudomonas phage RVTF4 TaxID=3236931 RepID=A0AB39CCN5_9VIRU